MRTKISFERGRFFIETGTAASFHAWLKASGVALWAVPNSLIVRIGHFIEIGDRDSATNLWLHICEFIDNTKSRLVWATINIAIRMTIAFLAIYSFIWIITR